MSQTILVGTIDFAIILGVNFSISCRVDELAHVSQQKSKCSAFSLRQDEVRKFFMNYYVLEVELVDCRNQPRYAWMGRQTQELFRKMF